MKKNYTNLLLMLLLISSMTYAQKTVFVDFGGSTQHTDNNYNNVDDVGDMTPKDLMDDSGAATGFKITLTDEFIDKNFNGPGSDGEPDEATGDAAIFDKQATRDSFFGSSGHGGVDDQLGTFEFTGLDNNKYYSFSLFAARIPGSNDRVAQYEFVGSTTESATLNASNNKTEIAFVKNVQPTGGKITLNVTPHSSNTHPSKYFYIGALKMQETVGVLSIEEAEFAANGFNVYPNPVGDELIIDYQFSDYTVSSISVFDITGRLVYNSNNSKNQISTTSFRWNRLDNNGAKLAPGTYFLKLQTEKNAFSKKLILK